MRVPLIVYPGCSVRKLGIYQMLSPVSILVLGSNNSQIAFHKGQVEGTDMHHRAKRWLVRTRPLHLVQQNTHRANLPYFQSLGALEEDIVYRSLPRSMSELKLLT
jgi:hypothetical protein